MAKATLLTTVVLFSFGTVLDDTLRKFKDDAIATLGKNLVALLHHGSRAKCEAHAESDYDSIIIVKRVNEKTIKNIQNLLHHNPGFTAYLLSLRDIGSLPKGHLLEFMYAKPLYGRFKVNVPTGEEVRQYLSCSRREELTSIRHWLMLPHPLERKARMTYYELKFVYLYLSYLAFIESGKLPPTRKDTIAYFKRRKGYSFGVKLLQILDNWNNYKDDLANNPDRYLFMLERFFRNAQP